MKRPRLTRRQQRAWRKLLKPLLKRPRHTYYEERICQVPRPRGTVVVIDLGPHLRGNTSPRL